MPRFFVTDSGSTERLVQRFLVVDSGGTTRTIQRAFVIDSGGTARQFFSNAVIAITDQTALTDGPFGESGPLTATYRLDTDGFVYASGGDEFGTLTQREAWITPQNAMTSYEVRADQTTSNGTTLGGTMGTWLSLGSVDRDWTMTKSATATGSESMTVQIRRASDGTVLDSASITITITRLGP